MYKKLEYRLTKSKSIIFNIFAVLLFLSGYFTLVCWMLCNPNGKLATSMLQNNSIVILFLVCGFTALMHELLHGIPYRIFGGKVKYGIKLLYLYTMDISGKYYGAKQMLIVMLSPLIILTLILSILGYIYSEYIFYAWMGILFNISGSIGDMVMTKYILLNGKGCKVKDELYGFSLYLTKQQSI